MSGYLNAVSMVERTAAVVADNTSKYTSDWGYPA